MGSPWGIILAPSPPFHLGPALSPPPQQKQASPGPSLLLFRVLLTFTCPSFCACVLSPAAGVSLWCPRHCPPPPRQRPRLPVPAGGPAAAAPSGRGVPRPHRPLRPPRRLWRLLCLRHVAVVLCLLPAVWLLLLLLSARTLVPMAAQLSRTAQLPAAPAFPAQGVPQRFRPQAERPWRFSVIQLKASCPLLGTCVLWLQAVNRQPSFAQPGLRSSRSRRGRGSEEAQAIALPFPSQGLLTPLRLLVPSPQNLPLWPSLPRAPLAPLPKCLLGQDGRGVPRPATQMPVFALQELSCFRRSNFKNSPTFPVRALCSCGRELVPFLAFARRPSWLFCTLKRGPLAQSRQAGSALSRAVARPGHSLAATAA